MFVRHFILSKYNSNMPLNVMPCLKGNRNGVYYNKYNIISYFNDKNVMSREKQNIPFLKYSQPPCSTRLLKPVGHVYLCYYRMSLHSYQKIENRENEPCSINLSKSRKKPIIVWAFWEFIYLSASRGALKCMQAKHNFAFTEEILKIHAVFFIVQSMHSLYIS